MGFSAARTLKKNTEAAKLVLTHDRGIAYSSEQVVALTEYMGFGGLRSVAYGDGTQEEWKQKGATENDLKLFPAYEQFYGLLRENLNDEDYSAVLKSLKNSALTAFYTPAFVPQTIFTALRNYGIRPRRLYEPSAGSGVFILEALNIFSEKPAVTAVEKDLLTAMVLRAICSHFDRDANVQAKGFEETEQDENGQYDLVISNIPFGDFSVYDPGYKDQYLMQRIHNYFFAKGLDKLGDGGLLIYLTTDGFLNSPGNIEMRKHVFSRADFISLSVCPDNLMADTGGTQSPSHLLVLQKNSQKQNLSLEESLLVNTVTDENEFGKYYINSYLKEHRELFLGDTVIAGKNQYGKAHLAVIQQGELSDIAGNLSGHLLDGLANRFNPERYNEIFPEVTAAKRQINIKAAPGRNLAPVDIQLGLFDVAPPEIQLRAQDYLIAYNEQLVAHNTAKIFGIVRSSQAPDDELLVCIAAKHRQRKHFTYRIYSNSDDLKCPQHWLNSNDFASALGNLGKQLLDFGLEYTIEGEINLPGISGIAGKLQNIQRKLGKFDKEGLFIEYDGQVAQLTGLNKENGTIGLKVVDIGAADTLFYRDYIQFRDQYLELQDGDTQQQRSALRDSYNKFIASYGILNARANQKRIEKDPYGLTILSSVERREGGSFVPSDMLYDEVNKVSVESHAENVAEALAVSLNAWGKVDINYIADLLSKEPLAVIGELGDRIYVNPVSGQWETADKYLSGNVVEKLNQAQKAAGDDPGNEELRRSLEAIQKAQREPIPFELLDFNLGERWIPDKVYSSFASELFKTDTEVFYFRSGDRFKVNIKRSNDVTRKEYAVYPKSGANIYAGTLLESALENTTPLVTYETEREGKKIRLVDREATQLAGDKIYRLRNEFLEWLNQRPAEEKKELEDGYNRIYNCYVKREFDGSHLTFPGLDLKAAQISSLYPSQMDGTWRIIQERGALIDHAVGLGKTMIMILAAQELKRLGLSRKSMIIALNANIDEIVSTYRAAYPQAKILAPGKDDFSPKNRKRLFHEIKNNNWDCVIITHDQFLRIPQSLEVQREIFGKELELVEMDLLTIREEGGDISKKMLRGLEIRQNNLLNELRRVSKSLEDRRDEEVSFEEMGIDHLFVDESHKFKNLTFSTRHTRVAGIGNTRGSMKALNMLFAIRTLQKRFDSDRCVTFLSGTPISNSLSELYLLFKYMCPRELERQQVENFDGWAAVFARKSDEHELSVTNEVIIRERFRTFIKLPELAQLYNEITDHKTSKQNMIDQPELEEVLVNLVPSQAQEDYIQRLMEFARTGDASYIDREPLTAKEQEYRMLIATDLAKKMTVDMRLLDPQRYGDHPNNKINTCAQKVREIYVESSPYKGTQLIFCDSGTPGTKGFNIYEALKEALVSGGIPECQIAFIHDWPREKRKELYRQMNAGEIRVLIGSTDKAGTGLNVQERVVAMHHLDVPYRPIDFGQRNGRGVRPRNWLAKIFNSNKVKAFIYATERTLDSYKFNLLKYKQMFIGQINNADVKVRSIDEGAFDENTGMNYAEYMAVLSGDTSLLKQSQLEQKIIYLESLRVAHYREKRHYENELESLQKRLPEKQRILDGLVEDDAVYRKVLLRKPDGTKINPVQLDGFNNPDPEAIGKFLYRKQQEYLKQDQLQTKKIGHLYGFDLYLGRRQNQYDSGGYYYAQRPGSPIKYTYSDGLADKDNPRAASRLFLNALDQGARLIKSTSKEIQEMQASKEMLTGMISKPFIHADALLKLKQEVEALKREINLKHQQQDNIKDGTMPYSRDVEGLPQWDIQPGIEIDQEKTPVPGKKLVGLTI